MRRLATFPSAAATQRLKHFSAHHRLAAGWSEAPAAAGAAWWLSSRPPSRTWVCALRWRSARAQQEWSGSQLYEEFTDHAGSQGCTEMRASTAVGNFDSIRFHRSLGFAGSVPLPDSNGPDRPRDIFWRRLSPSHADQ